MVYDTYTHIPIYISYLTVGTLPPPHDYVPHAKEFGNKMFALKDLVNFVSASGDRKIDILAP